MWFYFLGDYRRWPPQSRVRFWHTLFSPIPLRIWQKREEEEVRDWMEKGLTCRPKKSTMRTSRTKVNQKSSSCKGTIRCFFETYRIRIKHVYKYADAHTHAQVCKHS